LPTIRLIKKPRDLAGSTGNHFGSMYLKIAAIAITNEAIALSCNLLDFENVPGLKVEDWSA